MKAGKKFTGGKYHARRKVRAHERRGREIQTIVGNTKRKSLRVKGGNMRQKLLRASVANLSTGKKVEKVEIKNVIETPQNKFLARQNRLMKGAIIETSRGKARITNRPTQEGVVNAVLVE